MCACHLRCSACCCAWLVAARLLEFLAVINHISILTAIHRLVHLLQPTNTSSLLTFTSELDYKQRRRFIVSCFLRSTQWQLVRPQQSSIRSICFQPVTRPLDLLQMNIVAETPLHPRITVSCTYTYLSFSLSLRLPSGPTGPGAYAGPRPYRFERFLHHRRAVSLTSIRLSLL